MTSPLLHVLVPGRHHLITAFQVQRLREILRGEARDEAGNAVEMTNGAAVVWAVTSATHHGTRRNPVPANRREAMIEATSDAAGLTSLVAPVPDVPHSPRFASTVVRSASLTLGLYLTPATTVVACSTPEVAALFRELGYRIVPMEDGFDPQPELPWRVLELAVADGAGWRDLVDPAALRYLERYRLLDLIRATHADPTVSADGDLTQTRDYAVYAAAFDEGSDRKWEQVEPFIVPGRIVDLGCAAGGLLARASRDPRLFDSDLFGVDVSRALIAEAEHRRDQGAFANPNVFFAQRNLPHAPVFDDRSVHTTITVALTHEISSYGNGVDDLRLLAQRIFQQTAPGGVWINSDVLGPAGGERLVNLVLEGDDPGEATDFTAWSSDRIVDHLAALTPSQTLTQFAADFPRLSGARCQVEWIRPGVAQMPLRDAMEFLTTRDYRRNWLSECHERFTTMEWSTWRDLLTSVGFELDPVSGPWRNDWLVENRFAVGAGLCDPETWESLAWPDTHILTVARRPI